MAAAARIGAGLMLCLAVTPVWLRAETAETPRKPNLLLITADDLGLQLGCYGYRGVTTPHLDRLAVEGVRFNRAYVTAASCSPSRASLLTGLYPHQNGQLGLAHLGSSMKPGLPNLVSLLKTQGYRTGQIGKLHVEPEADFPFDEKHSEIEPTRDPQAVRALCEKFLRPNDRQPFLLYLNLFDPHKPFTRDIAGSPKVKVGPAQAGVLSFMGGDTPELRQETADYLTCINRLDEIMGEVLEVLRQRGLEQNTLVVFLSDNGPELPRGKVTCFEAGTRVPLLVRWTGRFRPGVREELVSTVDLLPTMLALVNVPEPAGLLGRSLVPLLEGRKVSWRETLATEFNSHEPRMINPQRALRDGRYKLILTLLKDPALEWPDGLTLESYQKIQPEAGRGEFVELYDLESDPDEFKNLAGKPALKEVEARLRRALEDWRRKTKDPLLDSAKLRELIREGTRALETGTVLKELHRKQEEARKAGQPIPNTVTPEEMEKLRSRPFGQWNPLPAYPQEPGVAGAFGGLDQGVLIVAGGSNFQPRPGEDRWQAPKQWKKEVFVLPDPARSGASWQQAEDLSAPCGNGASAASPLGLVCVGGEDGVAPTQQAFLLRWEKGRIRQTALPDAPVAGSGGAAAVIGRTLYYTPGQTGPELASAVGQFWALELPDGKWQECATPPGPGRAFASLVAQQNGEGTSLYWLGGRRAKEGADGKSGVEPLRDVYEYSPVANRWRRKADAPVPLMAAPAVAWGRGQILVLGGDDGALMARTAELKSDHPGFSRRAWKYDVQADRWEEAGSIPANQVASVVAAGREEIFLVSGEIRPRHRTTAAWRILPTAKTNKSKL